MSPELWEVLGAETVEVSAVLGVLNDLVEEVVDVCLIAHLGNQKTCDLPVRKATSACRLALEWTEFIHPRTSWVTMAEVKLFNAKARSQRLHHELLGWRYADRLDGVAVELQTLVDEFAATVRAVCELRSAEVPNPLDMRRIRIKTS